MTDKNVGKETADLVGEKKSEVKDEVATDLAKDAVRSEAKMATGNESEVEPTKYPNLEGTNFLEPYLTMGIAPLERAIDKKKGLPEEQIALLLTLERNGQNRTEFVKMLKDRLDIDDIKKELPAAGGPDYTNDTTNLTDL